MIFLNITNSYKTKSHTGIQRVVKQLVARLASKPAYKALVIDDRDFFILNEIEIHHFLEGQDSKFSEQLLSSTFKRGDIFFDLDGSWGDAYDQALLFSELKKRGVIIVKMHYDAVPVLFPEFSHQNTVFRYLENFNDALRYVDHWICISKTVEKDFHRIAEEIGASWISTSVVNLGADINAHADTPTKPSEEIVALTKRDYILCVGTVEVRKNYLLMLEVFDEICARHPELDVDLVIIGKPGWNNETVIGKISQHPLSGKRVHWLKNVNDSDLARLFQHACVNLNLSHYEGYGLPVAEALLNGTPVVCSADSAMEEISNGYATCVDNSIDKAIEALMVYLPPNDKKRITGYQPVLWEESARQMDEILQDFLSLQDFSALPRQAVYISVRPSNIRRSILSLKKHMKFIEQVVILTNQAQYADMKKAIDDIDLDIILLSEKSLIRDSLNPDHQARNTYLRYCLYKNDLIDDNFISLDDDVLIINDIDLSEFVQNGQHCAYYFFDDGTEWLGAFPQPTSFDRGLFRTADFLQSHGYDTKLYNAHQPQIINKNLAIQILQCSIKKNLDEWSSYFNIAKHIKPEAFVDKRYKCAGWPPNFNSWLPSESPEVIHFYNDYPFDDDIDAIQMNASKWLDECKENIVFLKSVKEEIPVLHIQKDKIYFTKEELFLPRDRKLMVPVYTSERVRRLSYKFLHHNIDFYNTDIPDIIFIPLSQCNDSQSVNVKVEVELMQGDKILTDSFEAIIFDN